MPCTANARAVRPACGPGHRRALLVALAITLLTTPAYAQRGGSSPGSPSSLRMRDTTIEGERPTPDVFFIVPTGKGGNLRAPHRRDYSAEILEPVVKPWLDKDQNVSLAGLQHVSQDTSDWKEALDAPAPAPPPRAPALEPRLPVTRPAVAIPPAALSGAPSTAPVPAAPVPPPAVAPPPPRPPASGDVPILVPPQ